MNLQQPEVPGIWGSWDPSTGPQRDSGSSDWPTYDRTLVRPGEGLEADGAGQLQEQSLSGAAAKAPRKASVNDSTKAGNVASGHISDGKAMLTRIVTASAQLEVNTVSAARMSTDPQGQISVTAQETKQPPPQGKQDPGTILDFGENAQSRLQQESESDSRKSNPNVGWFGTAPLWGRGG